MQWDYINIDSRENMIMSGWKLYVFGNTVRQSIMLEHLLINTVRSYNLTAKVATDSIISRNRDRDIAWSSMVIYLTEYVFIHGVNILLHELGTNLKSYEYSGRINGAMSLDGKIHCRYDLKAPVNAKNGVSYDTYLSLYRGEDGPFNIKNNKNIFK